jgi:crotonobetainyl-CoA:carnitine CoA-transferase CaiB-like acyl-CoA transferase
MDLPELADDERFATNADRVVHRDQLVASLAQRFCQRTTDEWVARLDAAGVPVGKVRGVLDAFAAAEAAGRAATTPVSHPAAGKIPLVASPIRLTEASLRRADPPPQLGQDTAEIVAEVAGTSAEAAGTNPPTRLPPRPPTETRF